jgi:hypothetical protein
MRNRLIILCLLVSAAMAACTARTDAVSPQLNACLLLTEAEVETAIGTPVSAPEKRSEMQCLYHAKRSPDETVVLDINQESGKDRRSLFNSERTKEDRRLVAGIGDGAILFTSPPGDVHLTFIKNETLVNLTMTSPRPVRPVEAVTLLGKTAAHRLTEQLTPRMDVVAAAGSKAALPAWAGDWYGCQPMGSLNAKGHLILTPSDHWSLTASLVTPGTLVADKGQWHMESLQDILHGTYQVTGKDSFLTTGILNVRWDKVAKHQGPSRFDRVLYKSLAGSPHKIPVKRFPPVEPALVGVWEGTAKFVDRQEEFIWSINANNLSEFYKAILWGGEIRRDENNLQLVSLPGQPALFRVNIRTNETLELTGVDGVPSQWSRKETMLARC